MKTLIVLSVIIAISASAEIEGSSGNYNPLLNENSCYSAVGQACKANIHKAGQSIRSACNAKYGSIDTLEPHLVDFANEHISHSYEYLLTSTHFSNYIMNRDGFAKLFKDLSDAKWNEGIKIIKHLAKRGGRMSFTTPDLWDTHYEMYEIESLSKALDNEKKTAEHTFEIHANATRKLAGKHDPELSYFLEEEFIEKQADTIRSLAGHVADLDKLLSDSDSSLSLYLFDEYLKNM